MAEPIVIATCDAIVHNNLATSATPAPYLEALALAGLTPVQLPTVAERFDVAPLLAVAAGVLVTGARSNVHPSHYGAAESETAAPFDRDRDRTSLSLIRAALARGVPLFCICRGFQELNVVFGGTLDPAVHERPGRRDHRGADSADMDVRFGLAHDVELAPGGVLAGILGAGPVRVNSVHRQGIDRLGDGLAVEARAPDGLVEAVSVPGASFALGVQWHPEYLVRTDSPSRALFEAFAGAVRRHAAGRHEARAA